ncbi:hypothetical protein JVT61DRAFT_3682 [Boletus reticuloceps]|uniref:Crinkler effector protein N-terminal domain-containing protein n=1 Tax=Boletus reticuloceps TaxID=495285 RepID=A0A8I3A7Q1_9AGAM|nr:hypothetical protein JVT61DRAFT_3682 [Boletus reticuloceps]
MSTTPVALNCLISGQDSSRIFHVKVPSTDNVIALKEAIKEKISEEFNGVNPTDLTLWNVSLPCDNVLEQHIQDVKLSDDTKLHPVKKLSRIFSGAFDDELLHIIVEVPLHVNTEKHMDTVFCLVWGKDVESIFRVHITIKENLVLHLKMAISSMAKLDMTDMALWNVKISLGNTITERIQKLNLNFEKPLQAMDSLSTVFHDPPNPNSLHIIITSCKKPPASKLSFHIFFY